MSSIRNVSIDNLNKVGKIPRISTGHPRKTLSFKMSKSGLSDLITSPHRASSVGAILVLDPAVLQAVRPHREQGTSDPDRSEAERSVIP